jgi:hypothetical protein
MMNKNQQLQKKFLYLSSQKVNIQKEIEKLKKTFAFYQRGTSLIENDFNENNQGKD